MDRLTDEGCLKKESCAASIVLVIG
jgi:hypothetical protein